MPEPLPGPPPEPRGRGSIKPARLPDEDEDIVASFFDLDGASRACALNSFDQEELVETIVGHIRNGDPIVSLSASRQFWGMMKDMLHLNGRTGQMQVVENRDGQKRRLTSTSLLTRLKSSRVAEDHALPTIIPSSLIRTEHPAPAERSEDPERPDPVG